MSVTTELLGYAMPGPLTAAGWVTQWRVDPVWVPLAVLAVAVYVVGVRRLRRRGDRWPVGRTVLWVAGWLVLVWATSSGPGVYGRVLFSMHMVQHMTLAMVVPVLLVLAAPLTLALRALPARADGSREPREWLLAVVHSRALRLLAHPVVAGAIFTGSLVVFYTSSPLFDVALRTHTGHVLMTAHFLATGYLFAWVICGPDPGPRRPPYPLRMILLFAVMGFHAFFGISIMGSARLIGEQWFAPLDRPWGLSLLQDQQAGGAIGWALGELPIVVLVLALAAAWIRADRREALRFDRRGDRDGDAELAAYNARLHQLANPTERQPQ